MLCIKMFWTAACLLSACKVLFLPAYRSTDFEVHRNWLAITHSLPYNRWYYEKTSEWTLDYPPLFAWFEFALSHIAHLFDPNMTVITNLNYTSPATVLFQRLSVILTDLVFVYSAKEFCELLYGKGRGEGKAKRPSELLSSPMYTLFFLLICNMGLLLVDHVHFQYNGFLFGVSLLSITRICQGRCAEGSMWFATLLNLKHIYLYTAPAYFVFLLRNYCFQSNHPNGGVQWTSFSVKRLAVLGTVVIAVFGLSFGPFIAMGQFSQVLSRLFPFKRGLCHAYWAPNFWALYNCADKAATLLGVRLGYVSAENVTSASMTGGLVQEFEHTVLPSVSPPMTLVCTALALLPCILHMLVRPSGFQGFLRGLVLCAFGSYLFGWHVHEKAVLLITVPLTLLAVQTRREGGLFLFVSTVGHFSLFPLIFTSLEIPVKYSMFVAFTWYSFRSLGKQFGSPEAWRLPLLTLPETVYLFGLLLVDLYCGAIHALLRLDTRLPFLPLMARSGYCAIGMIYAWLALYKYFFQRGALDAATIAQKTKSE